ncbi:DUF58 domain-containing protein [Paraglaciecola aestuariivivens]
MFTQNMRLNWLNKRIPAASEFLLNQGNIFIFPAKFGCGYMLLVGLLFVLGSNYQNNLILFLCYFLLALFLVCLLSSYRNFSGLHIQIGKSPEVFAGDNLHLPLWVNANSANLTTNGLINLYFYQQASKLENPLNDFIEFDANQFTNPLHLSYPCLKRGKMVLPRVTIESFFPLGLFRCWSHLAFQHTQWVYPKPIASDLSLYWVEHGHNSHTLYGAQGTTGQEDFSHLKAYQLGDPLKHLAWKQLAKGQGLVSKVFASETNKIGWLSLPQPCLSPTYQPEQLEVTLGHLCFHVLELSRLNQPFGMKLGALAISPNTGAEHRIKCLNALAQFSNGSNQR